MSSTTTESPIRKVIFLQRIFRFAGRTVKDLVIINDVCKDFEETMQAHHTFNLVLYDNIIKKRHQEEENIINKRNAGKRLLDRCVKILANAPAWIVYQWTTVNEHDETQRELLKVLLLFQAKYGNEILLREQSRLKDEDPSTTHQLLRHLLETCVTLGIAKEVLESCTNQRVCITRAIRNELPCDSLRLLLDFISQYADIKMILEQCDFYKHNSIMVAIDTRLSINSFKVLLEYSLKHANVKKLLEHEDSSRWNVLFRAAATQLEPDTFRFLLDFCLENANIKKMLEIQDYRGRSCIMVAAMNKLSEGSLKLLLDFSLRYADLSQMLEHNVSIDGRNSLMYASSKLRINSIKVLIAYFPSNAAFQRSLSAKSKENKTAIDVAQNEEVEALLQDPDCWKKCREWLEAWKENTV